jgi:hypothetical protein
MINDLYSLYLVILYLFLIVNFGHNLDLSLLLFQLTIIIIVMKYFNGYICEVS